MGRARRYEKPMVLAYLDLDGLKTTNDQDGHGAGDARLRDAVNAMRSKLRSYEPIVRYGGDEFVCSLVGVDLATVKSRFEEINAVLADRDHPGSLSVGLAEMQADETLEQLIDRADIALAQARGDARRS
jgi:diguanylate cyclase (GGDEF)-like protein